MPQAALIVAAVAAVAGSVMTAHASQQQGKAAAERANFEAAVRRQQAEREREIAGIREEDFRKQQSRLMARRRAVLGASGIEAGQGSALLVSEDFASEIELQALRVRNTGEVSATRLEQQASLTQLAGAQARRAGNLRAGASLLQGIGQGARIMAAG